ncbi:MAG: protein translocase subunit SecF [Frankiales bacterium]|nr:protein translocase subunit SecF [Frankiales bacterium]
MSVFTKLYRGETRFNFIGSRKRWYAVSLVLVVICILSIALRGFNVSIDFKGGTQFQINKAAAGITTTQVENALAAAGEPADSAAQEVGSGSTRSIIIKMQELNQEQQHDVSVKFAQELHIDPANISIDSVSSSWGSDVTKKAVQGLIIFLIAVFLYITVRYDWKMATGALVALLHDLVIAAGIYSIVGFELTPSTVVGLLTILGFSLYDTVVVFDKVSENTRDILATARMSYADAANLAVNQTLMRSINTSVISLLPVAGLLFVGAGLLGVGTIKDLALILFVGLAVGAYSSLFLATPIVVELKNRDPQYQHLVRRVAARRANAAKQAAAELASASAVGPAIGGGSAAAPVRGTPRPAPRPGARRPDRKPRKRT